MWALVTEVLMAHRSDSLISLATMMRSWKLERYGVTLHNIQLHKKTWKLVITRIQRPLQVHRQVVIWMMPLLIDETPPAIEGEVAVIDATGEVFAGLADFLSKINLCSDTPTSRI